MATTSSSSSNSSGPGAGYATLAAAATKSVAGEPAKRPYYGKCQYKTGKCFNERTLKRNGDAHSLCEEHRVKQNLIQRRSDRKYQTVHAIRRRERSQRRAVLKKQVSMAVAQQLFYEHQQQKSLGGLPLQLLAGGLGAGSPRSQPDAAASVASPSTLVPPIQIPSASEPGVAFASTAPVMLPFPIARADASAPFVKLEQPSQRADAVGCKPGDESSPTGIDDLAPDAFLAFPGLLQPSADGRSGVGEDASDDELELCGALSPIVSCRGDRELWTDEDIEFLQTLLLP